MGSLQFAAITDPILEASPKIVNGVWRRRATAALRDGFLSTPALLRKQLRPWMKARRSARSILLCPSPVQGCSYGRNKQWLGRSISLRVSSGMWTLHFNPFTSTSGRPWRFSWLFNVSDPGRAFISVWFWPAALSSTASTGEALVPLPSTLSFWPFSIWRGRNPGTGVPFTS